jgi:RNA polymerase sigma-70 factor, ECF subfamily
MQMVQPRHASSPISRPLQPPPAFNDALPHWIKSLRDGSSEPQPDPDAEFRAGLLSATPHLRAFAISLIGQREAADDLVQNTIVRALQYRSRFEPGTNLQAWLITMLRHIFYSDHRKRRREVEDADGLYAATLATPAEQPGCVELADLRSVLMRLPDEQREAVLLVGAEGYSYEEAAEICGTKIGTIKSRVNRARRRLAELLGHEHEGHVGPDGVGV